MWESGGPKQGICTGLSSGQGGCKASQEVEQTPTQHLQNTKTRGGPRHRSQAEPGAQSKFRSEETQLLQKHRCVALRTVIRWQEAISPESLSAGMTDQVVLSDRPETSPFLHSGWSVVSPLLRVGFSTGLAFPGTLPHPHPHSHPSSICLSPFVFPASPPVAFWTSIAVLAWRRTSLKSEISGCQRPRLCPVALQQSSCPTASWGAGARAGGGTSRLAQGRVQGRWPQASAGHGLGSSTAAAALLDMPGNPAMATDACVLLSVINTSKPPNRHRLLALPSRRSASARLSSKRPKRLHFPPSSNVSS